MNQHAATIVVLPRAVATAVITRAVSRGGWAVSIAVVVLAVPVVIDLLVARSLGSWLPVPLAAASVMLLALLAYGWKPSTLSRIAFLAVGGVCAFAWSATLLLADPSLAQGWEFVTNRMVLPLVLVGASVSRPTVGLIWSLFGFGWANLVLVGAAVHSGVEFSPGWGPSLSFAVFAATFLALAAIRASLARAVPDLAKLERETRRLDLESEFEQRAAAIIHDTVLSDLSVVMNTPGALDDRARERLRADVATLSDPSWLRESAGDEPAVPGDAQLRNAMVSLVSGFQWRGLTVDVTGDNSATIDLSKDAAADLLAAVSACLDNVVQHAGTGSAELVIGTTPGVATVMVVDHGVGFEPGAVAADRLGIRSSVVARIEAHGGTVRIWSQPGSGTSVFISLPEAADDGS